MWADSLFALERGHVLRLILWGGSSVLLGTVLFVILSWRRVRAPMLTHFAIQTSAWGVIVMTIGLWARRGLSMRDFAGAQHLVNLLWLNTGLDAGYVMLGLTLALAGWRLGPRPAAIGAGVGIILQGLALFLLDVRLIVLIGPLQ